MKLYFLALALLLIWLPTQCGKKDKTVHALYEGQLLLNPNKAHEDIVSKFKSLASPFGTLEHSLIKDQSTKQLYIKFLITLYDAQKLSNLEHVLYSQKKDDWMTCHTRTQKFVGKQSLKNFLENRARYCSE